MVIVAYFGLIAAILSAFTTIVEYTNRAGIHRMFSLVDILGDAGEFGSFIFTEYTGVAYIQFAPWQLIVLTTLGAAAIVFAFLGLLSLSKQTDNLLSFTLTILALLMTMTPAVALFIEFTVLKDQFMGDIVCGIYPIVSPIAMIICLLAVVKMRIRNVAYYKSLKKAEGLIFKGGNL